ncbi:MAG: hypothetical protein HW380_3439 [Magnetococcales bacterium]|nr:hypothetical protein [Magnetococcales bacterium]
MGWLVNSDLPTMREELTLHPAPPARDGSPVWTLADPARSKFFRINWLMFEILSRWHEGDAQRLLARIRRETPLAIEEGDVEQTAHFLSTNHLLRSHAPQHSRTLANMVRVNQGQWLTWLLHHYLFFRIPLVRPDRFLTYSLPWVVFFFSRGFFWLMGSAGFLALFLLLRQWDPFHAALLDHLRQNGLVGIGLALIVVKSVHELGHAYTAKRHGCRVPTMGVAFLVLLPMLYTDTTEAWKLGDRNKRLAIALAGIVTEGALAILALLAWSLFPQGNGREVAFWLATTSLATTLAINLSPFMRFDGYFILSDGLDMPNLHERSFAMARWRLREWLFSPGLPPPEETTFRMRWFFILFALATWIYRLLLFLGIALLVYHFFIKIVGLFLFAVEIGWFVVLPVWREIIAWSRLRHLATTHWRLPVILGVFLFFLGTPLSRHITAPAVAQPEAMTRIYVPEAARLERFPPPSQTTFQKGEELFVLVSPEIKRQKRLAQVRLLGSNWQLDAASLELGWARQARVVHGEKERSAATLEGLQAAEDRLTLVAPFAGELIDIPPDLATQTWIRVGTHLGTLVHSGRLVVEVYLDEEALGRLKTGFGGYFIPNVMEFPSVPLQVDRIDTMGLPELDEPLLASIYGGPIAVTMQQNAAVPEVALFRLRLTAISPPGWPTLRLAGQIHLQATPRSLLESVTRSALMVLVREWEM